MDGAWRMKDDVGMRLRNHISNRQWLFPTVSVRPSSEVCQKDDKTVAIYFANGMLE